MHLSHIPDQEHGNKLTAFTELIYGLPREGYRGCDRREPTDLLKISDPLEINAVVSVPDVLEKEE